MLLLMLASCNENNVSPQDITPLEEGLLAYDSDLVDSEINKLTVDLEPKADIHRTNLDALVQRVENQNQRVSVINYCYACVKTLPAISEIYIEMDSLGATVSRTLDIVTPDDGLLTSSGVHETTFIFPGN